MRSQTADSKIRSLPLGSVAPATAFPRGSWGAQLSSPGMTGQPRRPHTLLGIPNGKLPVGNCLSYDPITALLQSWHAVHEFLKSSVGPKIVERWPQQNGGIEPREVALS